MRMLTPLLVSCLTLMLGLAPLPGGQPIEILQQSPFRPPTGDSVQNLRVTQQSPDGAEVILTMDFSYDGSRGPTALILPVIEKKGQPGAAAWFGSDPVTVGQGRGTVSAKVRFFNDESGVPAQISTDRVRILILNDSARIPLTSIPFLKTIQWGNPNLKPQPSVATTSSIPTASKPDKEAPRRQAEAAALAEAQARAQAQASEKARLEAEAQAKQLAEEKQRAEQKVKAETEAREQARLKADAYAKQLAEEKQQAEEKAKVEAAAREEARLKAEADARRLTEQQQSEQKAQAEAEAKRLAEEKRLVEEKTRVESEAREAALRRAQAEARRLADEQKAADDKARIESEAREKARLKAEAEASRLAEEKRVADEKVRIEADARRQAEVQMAAAASATTATNKPSPNRETPASAGQRVSAAAAGLKSKITNVDVVNRSIDRSQITLGIEYEYNDRLNKPLLGIEIVRSSEPQVSEFFKSSVEDIGKSRRGFLLFPVKFQPPTAATMANQSSFLTDRVTVILGESGSSRQYDLYSATVLLMWRPAGTSGDGTSSPNTADKPN